MPTLHQPTTSTGQPKTFATLTPGDAFTGCVAVKKCNIAEARNGTQYLDLTVTDGQGDMSAKFWDHIIGNPVPKENTVIHIEAIAGQYQGTPQLTVQSWRLAEPGEYKAGQFIPVCPVNLMKLWERFDGLKHMIYDDDYQMNVVNSALDKAKETDPEAVWTGKLKGIGREFYIK